MNRESKLLMSVLILTSWAKGGLGHPINLWIVDVIVLFSILSLLLNDKKRRKRFVLCFLPILLACLHCVVSWTNPSYRIISQEDIKKIDFDQYFSRETNVEKIETLRNGFRNIAVVQDKDPKLALAIFLDLKNQFHDKYGQANSPCLDLIELYEDKLINDPIPFLPETPFSDNAFIYSSIHFICQLAFGVIIFLSLRTRREIRFFVYLMAINGGLLALAGIIQKLNYVPDDDLKEIFGIWDTPEPRYFFSSFTYKNHWASFALMCLFASLAILYQQIKNCRGKIIHEKRLIPTIFSVCLIIVAIPYSGSRSGLTVLLVCFVVFICRILFKIRSDIYKHKITVLGSSLTLFLLLCFSFSMSRTTSKEMLNNSLGQYYDLKAGKPPLRFALWQDLIRQIRNTPVWGSGFDSYRAINPLYQSKEIRIQRSYGIEFAHRNYTPLVGHGHCDLLEYTSEFGIPLMIIFFIYPLLCLRTIFRSPSEFPILLLISCLSFLLFSLVDFPSRTPVCLLLCGAMLGASTKYAKLTLPEGNRKN